MSIFDDEKDRNEDLESKGSDICAIVSLEIKVEDGERSFNS